MIRTNFWIYLENENGKRSLISIENSLSSSKTKAIDILNQLNNSEFFEVHCYRKPQIGWLSEEDKVNSQIFHCYQSKFHFYKKF